VNRKLIIIGLLALISFQVFPLEGIVKLMDNTTAEQLDTHQFPGDEESRENESKEGESEEDPSKIKKIELANEFSAADAGSMYFIKNANSIKTIGAPKDYCPEMIIPPPNTMV
jgi:hypothetical protein